MPDVPDGLLAEQVALVVATREPGGELRGQPELPVGGWLTVTPGAAGAVHRRGGRQPTGIAAPLHGQIAFASFRGCGAETLLLKAARLVEPLDARLARETTWMGCPPAAYPGQRLAGGG